MDFKNNNQTFAAEFSLGEPALPLQSLDRPNEVCELIGGDERIWQPYTRIGSYDTGSISLPTAMLENPHATHNNNFDGVLDADSCSFDSYSHEDSSDMDTLSDVEITDNSDDEINEAKGVYAQGCATEFDAKDTTTGTTLTDTALATQNIIHQQSIRAIIAADCDNANNDNYLRRGGERGREGEEESFSFKSKKQEKAKPKLPGAAALLQELAASSSSSSAGHVVVHKCVADCDCMGDYDCMYPQEQMQSQTSF